MELLRHRAEADGVLAYSRKPVPREVPNERFLRNTLRDLSSGDLLRVSSCWQQPVKLRAAFTECAVCLLTHFSCSQQAEGGGPHMGQPRAAAWSGARPPPRSVPAAFVAGALQHQHRVHNLCAPGRLKRRRSSASPNRSSPDSSPSSGDASSEQRLEDGDAAVAELLSRRQVRCVLPGSPLVGQVQHNLSRVPDCRGRGGVGSRVDETGPFLTPEEGQVCYMHPARQPRIEDA